MKRACALALSLVLMPAMAMADRADDLKKEAMAWVDSHAGQLERAAASIHGFAELGLEEYKSSKLLADMLEKGGFRVERGVADMPTAFVGTWGSGKPVIGILAEFDALPGLSQKAANPSQITEIEGGPGHGCGHNLFGAGSVGAALAMKAAMEKNKIPGTVKLFGTPAEEITIGKGYMIKAGVFDGVDACLNWHPSGQNKIHLTSNRALNSFEVVFRGKTAHAAGGPWDGRSALDAVELMDAGVNYLREHVKETVRIHYAIMDGGKAPNIVPDYARVWYFVRDYNRKTVEEVYARVLKCAEGAALMTGTTHEIRFIGGIYNYLPNKTVSEVVQKNMEMVGVPTYTAEETAYAKALQKTLGAEEKGMAASIEPLKESTVISGGSTDASDVSWIIPTNGELGIACIPPGSPGHSWATTSASGSSVGFKGMIMASKVLAASGIDLVLDAATMEKAKAEFLEKTKDSPYKSPIPDGLKPTIPERKK